MAALPMFASKLLEEAKRFLEKATDEKEADAKLAYLHAGLLVAFAGLEAHVNAICDDFLSREELTPHERGILAEHNVKLVDGAFEEQDTLQMQKLEDRVLFLCRRFSSKPIDRSAAYWSEQFRKSPSDTGGPMREAGKILLALRRRNPHRIPRPASSAFLRQEQQGFAIVNGERDKRIVGQRNAHLDKWWNRARNGSRV